MTLSGIVSINQPHIPDFSNPFGLLVHCHEKIAAQLRVLEQAAELLRKVDVRMLPEVFGRVEAACAHFALAGVKHTEDEELSLFPRLCRWGGDAGQEALFAMAELESQHRIAEQLHVEFDTLVERIPRDGSATTNDLDRFADLVAQLTTLYGPHIQLENNVVFPIAARVLPANEIQALGQEMRARRREILEKFQVSR